MDELRRVRELAEDTPEPDPTRRAQARSELMQLAQEEADSRVPAQEAADRRIGLWETFRERWLRPAPVAGLAAAVLIAVVGVGTLLADPATEPPARLAEPDPTEELEPEEEEPGELEAIPDDAIELAASCTDPEGRLTVAYPDDWFTPEAGEPGACRFFGEEAFDVDMAIGGQPVSDLEVRVAPVDLETLLRDDLGLDETERERLELDGRTTVRQRLIATGDGALPEGVWVERYLVDRGDETLLLSVQDEAETLLDERRGLLEEMVRSLRVSEGS